jgi:protein-tyrosine phosphatase
MAEAIFRKMVEEEGLSEHIEVDSAGTGHWHIGEPPHKGTRKILEARGISYAGIQARQVAKEDFVRFTYIIAMDGNNVTNLKSFIGDSNQAKIYRLLDFVPEREVKDVPDPYYTGNFEETYQLVSAGCEGLLNFIKAQINNKE